jgi:hypothetical protein
MTRISTDPRLEQIEQRMVWMAEMLMQWLGENYGDNSVSIFFLCGIIVGLVEQDWPETDRPQVYTDLLLALEKFAVEVGPVVVTMELQALAGPSGRKTKNRDKATVN